VKKLIRRGADNFINLGRAFRYRNYRLYFAGNSVSLMGYWMQRTAFSWLIYRMTGSELYLGIVGFTMLVPIFFITPFAGVLADRVSRHKIMIYTQIAATVQAVILAILAFSGVISIWQVIVLSLFYGLIRAFATPTGKAFVVDMVEHRENFGSAIALNSALFNLTRLVGPALAGLVVAFSAGWLKPIVGADSQILEFAGEGTCFLVNAVTYLAIIFCLLAMKLKPPSPPPSPPPGPPRLPQERSHPLRDLKEGITYSFGSPPIRSILILLAVLSLFGLPYLGLMPVLASEVLGPNTPFIANHEQIFGYLLSGVGTGAIIGAVFIGSRRNAQGLWKIIPIASVIFGAAIAASSFSRNFYLTVGLMVLTGMGQMVQFASANTLVQNIIPDEKRGRVMSLYTIFTLGTVPFGRLIMGAVAESIGTPMTLLIGGGISVLAALVFATRIGTLKLHSSPMIARK
jgi:MFS family permease